jgi:hypothetical protein
MNVALASASLARWDASPHSAFQPRVATRIARAVMLSLLLCLVFVPEYVQGNGDPAVKSALYRTAVAGLRLIDVLVLIVFVVHGFALGCMRQRRRPLPLQLGLPIAGFGIAILAGLLYGLGRGGHNFFFDWRALALGVGFYVAYRFWIHTPDDARTAVHILAVVAGVRIVTAFAAYFSGGGDMLLDLRIPLFDGPTLSAVVFAGLLAISLSTKGSGWNNRWRWMLFGGFAVFLVALCFRRSYWAEMAIGLIVLAATSKGRRLRPLLLLAFAGGIASVALGRPFMERLSSLDFTQSDSAYAEDNVDHVGDVLDAWDEVRASPVMGIGLGRAYPTWRIRDWKEESAMVHNAPLHVWLKYGLLGLLFYLAFHLSLFGCLRQEAAHAPPGHGPVVRAILAYLAAQFIVALGFTPWPYSAVQSTNLIAFLLAVAFVQEPAWKRQPFPLSPQASTPPLISKTQFSA